MLPNEIKNLQSKVKTQRQVSFSVHVIHQCWRHPDHRQHQEEGPERGEAERPAGTHGRNQSQVHSRRSVDLRHCANESGL